MRSLDWSWDYRGDEFLGKQGRNAASQRASGQNPTLAGSDDRSGRTGSPAPRSQKMKPMPALNPSKKRTARFDQFGSKKRASNATAS
jgi:hypothetical protein